MATPTKILVTDERRAWMRLRSHTVIFDRDPEFARFVKDRSGSVLSILRIWVADSTAGPVVIRHYLGRVRHCECGGWMSRRELYRLFRQATVTARLIGEGNQAFRARLSTLLRRYFGESKHLE